MEWALESSTSMMMWWSVKCDRLCKSLNVNDSLTASPHRWPRQLAIAGYKAQVSLRTPETYTRLTSSCSYSVGHLIVDSLASRLGIPLTYDASVEGYHGQGQVTHPTTPYEVTLYKSSPYTFQPVRPISSSPVICHRILDERVWSLRQKNSPQDFPQSPEFGSHP